MKNIAYQAEECNRIPTASTQNNAAFVESTFDESILNSGPEEEEDKTLMLSRELALDINPKQPDLTASYMLYGLYTWQVSKRKRFVYNPIINGKSAAYRTLSEMQEDYPWLNRSSILKALRRAERNLKGEFIMRLMKHNGQDQLHFLLSEKLSKKYKFDLSFKSYSLIGKDERLTSVWKREKSGLISFQKNDAIRFSVIGAILIANLQYVLDLDRNVGPLEDEAGNIYRELSPTALTKPVRNEKGEMKAPLPVSPDTITRTLKDLKNNRVIHEHPVENNFYTLVSPMKHVEANAAEVNTLAAEVNTYAAKVNTYAAKVNSKTEFVRCNDEQMNDIQLLFETSDSNRDRNTDGKCVTTQSVSLRETDCVDSLDESFLVRKNILLSSANDAIHSSGQRQSPEVPNFDIRDYAVYDVEDTDKVKLIGYDLGYEFIMADRDTGKPYTRQLEIAHFMAECKLSFASHEFAYTKADEMKLRDLFMAHSSFTPDMVSELICNDYFGGIPEAPKNGHDFHFFSRRIKNMKEFLRYLPQLIREKHLNAQKTVEWEHHPVTKLPMFNYSYMPQPFWDLAFADNKTPVAWDYFTVEEEKPELGTVLRDGQNREFLTGESVRIKTTRVKPVYYADYMSDEYDPKADQDIYERWHPRYDEMLKFPVLDEEWPEPVEFNWVEMKHWERKNGKAQFINRSDYYHLYEAPVVQSEVISAIPANEKPFFKVT